MLYSASLACADYLNMERDIRSLIKGGINMVHLDVMDGHYVPNLSLNLDLISRIRDTFPDIKLDVHLMVTDPMAYREAVGFAENRLRGISFQCHQFSDPYGPCNTGGGYGSGYRRQSRRTTVLD